MTEVAKIPVLPAKNVRLYTGQGHAHWPAGVEVLLHPDHAELLTKSGHVAPAAAQKTE